MRQTFKYWLLTTDPDAKNHTAFIWTNVVFLN